MSLWSSSYLPSAPASPAPVPGALLVSVPLLLGRDVGLVVPLPLLLPSLGVLAAVVHLPLLLLLVGPLARHAVVAVVGVVVG